MGAEPGSATQSTFFVVTETLKNITVFNLLLPLKIGFSGSVRPQTWGFDFGVEVIVAYAVAWSLVAACVGAWRGWRAGTAIVLQAAIYFFGTTGMPWLVLILVSVVIAWQVAGIRIAGLTLASFAFIALSGFWDGAMVTLQLCGAGVIVSFILGSILGIWAALDDRISAILRPIGDVLQTMPIFVFLIPAIMVFLVGEFTALVAIVLYALVPAARYVEHGIAMSRRRRWKRRPPAARRSGNCCSTCNCRLPCPKSCWASTRPS